MTPSLLCVAVSLLLAASAGADVRRVVSINACTDQLIWALADREQIAALSRFAGDPTLFVSAGEVRASGVRLIRGSAEEVLKLKPGLVVAGTFTRAQTRSWLAQAGYRVETFAPAESPDAAKEAVRRMAALLGQTARGERLAGDIDAAMAELRAVQAGGATVLQVQRRGFTSGGDTMLGNLLAAAGLSNAAARLGVRDVRQVPLEAIVKLRPDVIVVADENPEAADQGAALLRHPALTEVYPPDRRIVIPQNLLACGGPALPQAIRHLAREVLRVRAATGAESGN